MNIPMRLALFLLLSLATISASAASMTISSLSGAVTQTEINSFKTYMASQAPQQTPWGALNGTGHNAWADGTGGRELEAMGEMYEVSGDIAILNQMINWADDCTSQRNDLMSAANGGQRVLWTGLIDKVWVPNWPTDGTDGQSNYCGCESEDTIGHIAYCAKLILKNPTLWNTTVPDGNPYGYGLTYLQRATNYLAKCDEANDEYFIKWFVQPGTSLIVPPTNAAWIALNENVTAVNRQMMFTSGFQRLAEAHELLGDNPARVAQYDAIVKATVNQDLNGMINYPGNPRTANGQTVYKWGYYPTSTTGAEATEIHAEYDIIGVWRAFNRSSYGFTLPPLVPFANTMVDVTYLGTNTFALNVDGSGGTQSPIYSGWLFPADWNPAEYTTVAGVAYTNGWYSGSADIEAGILFMKNRRYLEFSVTPTPVSKIVQAGAGTTFTVAVAPLGGFTNVINLTVNGLPANTGTAFSSTSVNPATLNFASTNLTLSITTSNSTPTGIYTLNIIGTSGSVSHTNTVSLVVGSYTLSASPSSQTVSAGNGADYAISVATNSGFSGSVSFGISGLPANTSAGFSPGSLSGAGSSTLSVNTAANTSSGNYTLTIFGTNGAVAASTTVDLVVAGATPVWTGGSASDNNWSDPANWGGIALAPVNPLIFNGDTRLNNTNNTAAATTYSNIVFSAGAGAFMLDGNSITLGGNITNNSSNPQVINLGLNFNNNPAFDGAGNMLSVLGGLTNTLGAPAVAALTLADSGQISDLWAGGTNEIVLNDPAAYWTVIHNAASTAVPVPWVFEINAGTLNFGTETSAPNFSGTTTHNAPKDCQIANNAGSSATFNMINGTLTMNCPLNTATAANTTGTINQVGGTLNMNGAPYYFQGANGSSLGEVSIVNITGGTMNMGTAAAPTGPFYVASRGNGSLTVDGSGAFNCGTLDVSRNASGNTFGSVGTVNLNGGTILCSRVGTATASSQTNWQNGSSATFNFNGGTLKATAGSATFFQGSTASPVIPITSIVSSGGAVIDDGGNAITILEPLQYDATLDGDLDGGLTKLGTGTLTLTAASTYNGDTAVNAGTLALSASGSISDSDSITVASGATLDASGRGDTTLTLAAGQTLTGNGTVKGNVIVGNGATLAPGGSLTTLTFNNSLTLNGGSATVMEVSKSPTTNDAAQVAGTLTYGGTLVITNISAGAFSAGDSFKLFNAAGYSGAFTNIVPVIPAVNLAWNTNNLGAGILSVVSSPTSPPKIGAMTASGNNFIFSGSNGVQNWTYYLLASTNLALPLTNWTAIATNTFDSGGNFNLTNPLTPNVPQAFYLLKLQ
jgi:autotransporter-associated beta strand protein